MKPNHLSLLATLFLLSCGGNESGKFTGVWQQIDDPTRKITINKAEDSYYYDTDGLESSSEGVPGVYNADKNALEFDNGNGTITTFVYNKSADHLLALGQEFEKISGDVTDEASNTGDDAEAFAETDTPEGTDTGSMTSAGSESVDPGTSKCGKGELMLISGDNVRLRTEPDVTKQNILMQMNKGYEVVRLDQRDVSGQKWYRVCYDGNIGWVSGQYAALK